jgi:anion-transporting  ArsA/GET3 family ATPase
MSQLRDLLDDAPLVVCLGPGGVGKTTLSAVLALRAAATARRSLVLTIDPARRLADALGLPGLTNDPVEIQAFRRMHEGGSLSALMLDPAATFDHMIAMLVTDQERRAALLGNRYYQHMSRSLAGTLEYMAVERIHALVGSGDYDTIVLDTPPTTNALDFLEAPDRLAAFFSERVIRWFRPPDESKRGWAARLLDRGGARVMSLLGRVAGEEFVADTSGFFSIFGDLLGDFRTRGQRVGELLRDPRTVFVVVTSPDEARLNEALEIDRRLAGAGCRAQAFFVNRVDSPIVPAGRDAEDMIRRATDLLGGSHEPQRVAGFVRRLEALRESRERSSGQHSGVVERLRSEVGERPVFVAPAVPAGQSPRASLLAIYLGLFAEDG